VLDAAGDGAVGEGHRRLVHVLILGHLENTHGKSETKRLDHWKFGPRTVREAHQLSQVAIRSSSSYLNFYV
jgi:hypothetical protein